MSSQAIRVRPSGRNAAGVRDPSSPYHGCVDVVLVEGGVESGIRLTWQAARDLARAMRDPAYAPVAESRAFVEVRHEGDGSVHLARGLQGARRHWVSFEPRNASKEARERTAAEVRAVADAITKQAGVAEHDVPEVAMRVAHDQAAAARGGFPLGFTRDPDILREALKIHDTDSTLRRYASTSRMRSTIALPMPALKMSPPDPKAALLERAKNMSEAELRELMLMLEERT